MEHLLAGLNRAQHEAVTATEGYVRVIAGAGSGKTRALSHRFAYLVNELGILPGNILCVTFTNKSANEMRQRIHALTGDNDTGYINTFHGFCVSVLQEDSHAVQYPKSFLVLDNSDIDAMLGIIYEERGLTLRDMTYSAARDMIEIRKLFKEPEYYKDMITMSLDTLREKYERADTAGDIIFYGYLYQEKKCFGLDYNDLIKFSLYIFEQHEDIRLKWQQRLEYIAHIALFSNGDVAEQGDKVKLMTVHAAKGLEFPYVFLCGMNEGIFPSRKVRTLPGMEEERRLAFVALTRAEKGLYLSEADGRNFDGSLRYPSRFLLDIDRELLSFTHEVDETLLREAADDVARRDKYLREEDGDGTLPIGQRVRHAVFGEGTVLDVDLNKGAHVIQFDGMGTPRSISLRAKLEKIGP